MHATVVVGQGPPRQEWIIASRWGTGGRYLSIARTMIIARPGGTAPLHLAPRQSALALLRDGAAEHPVSTFLFAAQLPPDVVLAGRFAAVDGEVRLDVAGAALRLQAEGRCTQRDGSVQWRFSARRVPWIGELIEPATPLS